MFAEYTKENADIGKSLGGKDDLANIYALHNLGQPTGKKFIKALAANPNAKVNTALDKDIISGNTSLYKDGNITLAEAYANMGAKMREGDSYVQEARALQQGKASVPIQPEQTQVENNQTQIIDGLTKAQDQLSGVQTLGWIQVALLVAVLVSIWYLAWRRGEASFLGIR